MSFLSKPRPRPRDILQAILTVYLGLPWHHLLYTDCVRTRTNTGGQSEFSSYIVRQIKMFLRKSCNIQIFYGKYLRGCYIWAYHIIFQARTGMAMHPTLAYRWVGSFTSKKRFLLMHRIFFLLKFIMNIISVV